MASHKWTLSDMPDQSGKVVIVTGGNSGLGFETVKAFAQKGANVILACRNVEKGEIAKSTITQLYPSGKIDVLGIDLMDLSSVKNFAAQFKSKYTHLHILVNNAGIMMCPYNTTKDGFESQLGTNHLGHFALTGLLLELITKTPNSRVVNISSIAHKQWNLNTDDMLFENGKGYNSMKAYSHSKLANLLFTYELQKKFAKHGIQSISVAAHPGASYTNLGRFLEHTAVAKTLRPLIVKALPTPASGALPQIRAASDPNVKGGEYYGPSGFLELSGHPVRVKSNKESHNQLHAQKLWELSEKLTGVEYGI